MAKHNNPSGGLGAAGSAHGSYGAGGGCTDDGSHGSTTGYGGYGYGHRYGYGQGYSQGYGARQSSATVPAEASVALRPLIARLERLDRQRRRLEERGGRPADVSGLTQLLKRPIELQGPWGRQLVSLLKRSELRHGVQEVAGWDVHVDVRLVDSRLPTYYLCRVRRDYWAEQSLVVEDLYRSPGYPADDERFVRLMQSGHELYFLRVSPYRAQAATLLGELGEANDRWAVDRYLWHLGRHVLSAAWHEDQRLAAGVAQHFGVPALKDAQEALYLCLTAELCELRGAADEAVRRFFIQCYPQVAIQRLLERLGDLPGDELNELPRRAMKQYRRLSEGFVRFLQTKAPSGQTGHTVELAKLVFANTGRLGLIAAQLRDVQAVQDAAATLDRHARRVVDGFLGEQPTRGAQAR